jgi:GGDEF domain-containing protein
MSGRGSSSTGWEPLAAVERSLRGGLARWATSTNGTGVLAPDPILLESLGYKDDMLSYDSGHEAGPAEMFVHPDDAVLLGRYVGHPSSSRSEPIGVRMRRGDGSYAWFRCMLLTVSREDSGLPVLIFEDMSHEKALSDENSSLRKRQYGLLDSLGILFGRMGMGLRIELSSDGLSRSLINSWLCDAAGCTRDEFENRKNGDYESLVSDEDRTNFHDVMSDIRSVEQTRHVSYHIKRTDGMPIPMSEEVASVRDGDDGMWTFSFVSPSANESVPVSGFCAAASQGFEELCRCRMSDAVRAGRVVRIEYDLTDGIELPLPAEATPPAGALAAPNEAICLDDDACMREFFSARKIAEVCESGSASSFMRVRMADEGNSGVKVAYRVTRDVADGRLVAFASLVACSPWENSDVRPLPIDALTGGYTPSSFMSLLGRTIRAARGASCCAVMCLGLEGLSDIALRLGCIAADESLRSVAARVADVLGPHEFLGNLGHHALCVWLCGEGHDEVKTGADRLCAAVTDCLRDDPYLSLRSGLAFMQPGDVPGALLLRAEKAMADQHVPAAHEATARDLPSKSVAISQGDVINSKDIYVRTFGYFDVFVGGEAIVFTHAKTKELLALLVDHRGGFVDSGDIIAALWEDEAKTKKTLARCRKVAMHLRNTLRGYGIDDIIETSGGMRRVVPERFSCDYYDYLSGDPRYVDLFRGSYLSNYSWAEATLSDLSYGRKSEP